MGVEAAIAVYDDAGSTETPSMSCPYCGRPMASALESLNHQLTAHPALPVVTVDDGWGVVVSFPPLVPAGAPGFAPAPALAGRYAMAMAEWFGGNAREFCPLTEAENAIARRLIESVPF